MNKIQLRKIFLEKRQKLSQTQIDLLSLKILDQWKFNEIPGLRKIHIFLTISEKKEVNTVPLIKYFWNAQKEVYAPKISSKELAHFQLKPNTQLIPNKWQIFESKEDSIIPNPVLDCIFIPLLVYDINGNRIGYGKGFYDRFLKKYPQAYKIGLSFFDPIEEIKDIYASDIPLTHIITPYFFQDFL